MIGSSVQTTDLDNRVGFSEKLYRDTNHRFVSGGTINHFFDSQITLVKYSAGNFLPGTRIPARNTEIIGINGKPLTGPIPQPPKVIAEILGGFHKIDNNLFVRPQAVGSFIARQDGRILSINSKTGNRILSERSSFPEDNTAKEEYDAFVAALCKEGQPNVVDLEY